MNISSQDHILRRKSTTKMSLEVIDNLLNLELLNRKPASSPLLTLPSVLECLLQDKKLDKCFISRKLSIFCKYICINTSDSSKLLFDNIRKNADKIIEQLNGDDLFYDPILFEISAHLFSIRAEIYYIGKHGILACQYFGSKQNPKKRIFMHDDCYYVLEKIIPQSDTFSTRWYSDNYNQCLNNLQGSTAQNYNHSISSNKRISVKKRVQLKYQNLFDKTQNKENSEDKIIDGLFKSSDIQVSTGLQETTAANNSSNLSYREHSVSSTTCSDPNINISKNKANKPLLSDVPLINELELKLTNERTNSYNSDSNYRIIAKEFENTIGRLKFYNEDKEYGFIIMPDNSEIFVHKADLLKQNINTIYLAQYKKLYEIFLRFDVQEYQSKNRVNRKAVNIQLLEMQPIF